MNIFVKSDESFNVDVFVCADKDGKQFIFTDEKDVSKPELVSCEKNTITFRKPNYSDMVAIMSSSVSSNFQELTLNPAKMRYERFVRLVKDWTFVDDNKEKITPNRESIDRLNPVLANTVIDELERILDLQE